MADSEKKGFSLRKRVRRSKDHHQMPKISAPQQLQKPPPSSGSGSSVNGPSAKPRPRQAQDQTANLIKKRLSHRYAGPQDVGSKDVPPLPAMPAMPSLPVQFNQRRTPSPGKRGPQEIDVRELMVPNLGVDQCKSRGPEGMITMLTRCVDVKNYMADAGEADIEHFTNSLKEMRRRATVELQQNASRNRDQFIKVSKEAQKLNEQLQSLKTLLEDQAQTLGQPIGIDGDNSFEDGLKKRANRSSVANLEAMWNTQLQVLWKTIEGSQKFVAAIPGRHVLMETGQWVELDAATWKPRRPAHIVLLNDHLLVAVRKRKRVDPNTPGGQQKAPTKLVADRCFALQDVDLVDLAVGNTNARRPADERILANSVTVRFGHESFTYRTEKQSAKPELLQAFKSAVEELRRAERSEASDTTNKGREGMTYLATRDPAVTSNPGLLRTMSKSKDRPEILIDVEGKQENLRWVESQIDQLDIDVALQQFDEAVDRVERLRNISKSLKGNSVAQDLITTKVDQRAAKLAEMLTFNLKDEHSSSSNTQRNVSYLTRLDFASRARTAYLAARTESIQKRIRTCVFEGNTIRHVTAICVVYFTLIKNTVSCYQQCFSPTMMSACIVWAKEHLDSFNSALERALSGVPRGGDAWKQGLARAKELSKVMDDVGLDFGGLVGRGLE